jgi:hypothetical protein
MIETSPSDNSQKTFLPEDHPPRRHEKRSAAGPWGNDGSGGPPSWPDSSIFLRALRIELNAAFLGAYLASRRGTSKFFPSR